MVDPVIEIKSKLSIVDLVSQYVTLKKAGHYFKGLSPFVNEKTPSFYVSPQKDIAYCFSTNQGGDIFTFYQLVENCTFSEALKDLAEKTGVSVKNVKIPTNAEVEKKGSIIQIQELLSEIFAKELQHSPADLKYLHDRGVSDRSIKDFKLGLSRKASKFYIDFLLKKGFKMQDLMDSGSFSRINGDLVCKFKDRLIIPILDSRSNTIAFGARALLDTQKAKYLNSPETQVYKKNQTLYGFDMAKDKIRDTKTVILVEGYFDQIACYQNGYQNVVAVCGTALTANQVSMLSRFADRYIFCLDSDSAGQRAIANTAEIIAKHSDQIYVMQLGGFKDPSDCFNEDISVFEKSYSNPDHLIDFYLDLFLPEREVSFKNTKVLQDFLEAIFKILYILDDEIIVDIWLKEVSKKINISQLKLQTKFKSFRKNQKVEVDVVKKERSNLNLRDYLALVLYSDLGNFEVFKEELFKHKAYLAKNLFLSQLFQRDVESELDVNGINEVKIDLDVSLMQQELKGFDFSKLDLKDEIKKCLLRLSRATTKGRIAEIQSKLNNNSGENSIELLSELQNLLKK